LDDLLVPEKSTSFRAGLSVGLPAQTGSCKKCRFFHKLLNKINEPFMYKTLLFIPLLTFSSSVFAQKPPETGWHLKDFASDGYYGISLEKAYSFLQEKGIKPVPLIVGVLDTGIDTAHEDLTSKLWTNRSEIPGNGKDDDNNGYADDVHGWNFLGGASGNVTVNNSEWNRVYWRYKEKFDGKRIDTGALTRTEQYEYSIWQTARSGVVGKGPSKGRLDTIRDNVTTIVFLDSLLQIHLETRVYDREVLSKWKATSKREKGMKELMLSVFDQFDDKDLKNTVVTQEARNFLEGEELKARSEIEPPADNRRIITGNDDKDPETFRYGNDNIWAGNPMHGTHVAGIIGAARNNQKGVDGIADAAYLMCVRASTDGDEFDKDIAAGIRYAVDNGAKVINMSFGKSLSPDKLMVDDAVRYALSKDVLIVQAAGNSGRNISRFDNFPNPRFLFTDSVASNWITVGASDHEGYPASFSNYGNTVVDLFAPGVSIFSTVAGANSYEMLDGTSMASPVVAGVAALLRSCFPALTANETRHIILRSATIPPADLKHSKDKKGGGINTLCVSGGIVNAYTAVKLAYEYSVK
jgi:cell wall-associated protease